MAEEREVRVEAFREVVRRQTSDRVRVLVGGREGVADGIRVDVHDGTPRAPKRRGHALVEDARDEPVASGQRRGACRVVPVEHLQRPVLAAAGVADDALAQAPSVGPLPLDHDSNPPHAAKYIKNLNPCCKLYN